MRQSVCLYSEVTRETTVTGKAVGGNWGASGQVSGVRVHSSDEGDSGQECAVC